MKLMRTEASVPKPKPAREDGRPAGEVCAPYSGKETTELFRKTRGKACHGDPGAASLHLKGCHSELKCKSEPHSYPRT